MHGEINSLDEVKNFKVDKKRRLHSASHEEIFAGWTTDVYFVRTKEILRHLNLEETHVSAEIFATRPGILAGIEEALALLEGRDLDVWALPEGQPFAEKEVVLRISGPYNLFGMLETSLLGLLASSSGWATAAARCKEAAGDKSVFCFGARHVHPAVAPVMERAAIIGGVDGCSCILGAKLLGKEPVGTVPHAVFLIVGDTLKVAKTYDQIMPEDAPRLILVDTFKDEVEESLRVAAELKERLSGVRLDTPGERGGVTPGLVREVRATLDLHGYSNVKIFVSGGITAERIPPLVEAGADSFGVGSYISRAPAIDMTMDLKEVEGKPIAKRGRIPGITKTSRLQKVF